MNESPYSQVDRDKLHLRDQLAIDRTLLANERTLLSYLRAGIGLIIAGLSMMHFSTQPWFLYVGIVCIPLGFVAAIVGTLRFRKQQKLIIRNQKQSWSQKGNRN